MGPMLRCHDLVPAGQAAVAAGGLANGVQLSGAIGPSTIAAGERDAPVTRRHAVAPVAPLIEAALSRLRRQTQFARPLAGGGSKAQQIEEWLYLAAACVAALARPLVFCRPLLASVDADAIVLEGGVRLCDPAALRLLQQGGAVGVYLFTLGFDQATAFKWLGGDYSAHHVQNELSRETLFALGREVRRNGWDGAIRGARRVPVRVDVCPRQRPLWDAVKVQRLMALMGTPNREVKVIESGCFQPLHSILGLVLSEGGDRQTVARRHTGGGKTGVVSDSILGRSINDAASLYR